METTRKILKLLFFGTFFLLGSQMVAQTTNNGTYTNSTGESSITINGSSWSGLVVIESDFGSQYNETLRSNGIVHGDDLYDDSGYVKIGYISSYPSKSIITTLGGSRITLYKKE